MMVDLASILIFDPQSKVLYSATELPMSMNGNMLQLTLPTAPLASMPEVNNAPKPKKRSRAARSQDKKLSQAFKEANRRYRKKDGSLRAGRTQSDIAKLAHRLKKKM